MEAKTVAMYTKTLFRQKLADDRLYQCGATSHRAFSGFQTIEIVGMGTLQTVDRLTFKAARHLHFMLDTTLCDSKAWVGFLTLLRERLLSSGCDPRAITISGYLPPSLLVLLQLMCTKVCILNVAAALPFTEDTAHIVRRWTSLRELALNAHPCVDDARGTRMIPSMLCDLPRLQILELYDVSSWPDKTVDRLFRAPALRQLTLAFGNRSQADYVDFCWCYAPVMHAWVKHKDGVFGGKHTVRLCRFRWPHGSDPEVLKERAPGWGRVEVHDGLLHQRFKPNHPTTPTDDK